MIWSAPGSPRRGGVVGASERPGAVGPPSPVRSSKSCVRASGGRSPAARRYPRQQDPQPLRPREQSHAIIMTGYVEQLSAIVEQATLGNITKRLECKHFFSGAAVYVDGRLCMSLTPVGLAIKLPQNSRNTLMKQEGAHLLRYFPKAPIKKDYVVLPKAVLSNRKALRAWVRRSIEYVTSLPPPARGRR